MQPTLIEHIAANLPVELPTQQGATGHVSPSLRRDASFIRFAGEVSTNGQLLELQGWAGGNGHAPASQDDFLVDARHSGTVRLAVFDGVTPFERKGPYGLDQSVWAAGVTRTFVRGIGEPAELLADAHNYLHNSSESLSRHRPGTAAAVADITTDANGMLTVSAASAADCSVWFRRDGVWNLLVGGDHLRPEVRDAWEQWKRARPNLDSAAMALAEAVLLDDAENRTSCAVGRDANFAPRIGHQSGCEEVVLCSDGARLDPTSLNDISGHIDSFIRETNRGDVTVLRVFATPS